MMGERMLDMEEKKMIAAEEKEKRRAARAERKRLAIENGEEPVDEPDTEDEAVKGRQELAEAFERAE